MDMNDIRGLVTVIALATFLGIVLWAWSSKRKTAFDQAARLILDDDDRPASGKAQQGKGK